MIGSPSYAAPRTVAEAVELLAATPGAAAVAGGTDLVVGVRQGKRSWPAALVAVHEIAELRGIEADERSAGGLRLGALATHAEVVADPRVLAAFTALADASAIVGSPATRANGTVGGNVANASPAMELGAPLLVHGAELTLAHTGGTVRLPFADFLLGPGRTVARPGELVVALHLPAPAPQSGSAYVRLQYRRAMEIAVVGAAAWIALAEDGTVAAARIALIAVAPTCILVPAAAAALVGSLPSEAALAAAAALAADAASPIGDVRASAAYRTAQIPVAVHRALGAALLRARGDHAAAPVPQSNAWSP